MLLGPAPAVVIAVAGVLTWSLRARAPWPRVLDALVAHATATLAGALAFTALGDLAQGLADGGRRGRRVPRLQRGQPHAGGVVVPGARASARRGERGVPPPAAVQQPATGLLTGGAVLAYQRYGIGAMISLTAAVWCLRLSAASAWRLAR